MSGDGSEDAATLTLPLLTGGGNIHPSSPSSGRTMGISGRIAAYFQGSQLTPLIALVLFLLGLFAVLVTPKEEEPQINVTMANVLVPFPGRVGQGRGEPGRRSRPSR